jgi:hypothetical protein
VWNASSGSTTVAGVTVGDDAVWPWVAEWGVRAWCWVRVGDAAEWVWRASAGWIV